jgi:hypothetical protein
VERRVAEATPNSGGDGLVEAAMRARRPPHNDTRLWVMAVEQPVAICVQTLYATSNLLVIPGRASRVHRIVAHR